MGRTPISVQGSPPTSVRGAALTSVRRGEPIYSRVEAPTSVWGRGGATLGCAPSSLRKRTPTSVRGGAILGSASTVVGGGAPTSAAGRCTFLFG